MLSAQANRQLNPAVSPIALMYSLRFEGDIIEELWDLAGAELADMSNEIGMF